MSSLEPTAGTPARRTSSRGGRLARRFSRWPLLRLILASRALLAMVVLGILLAIAAPLFLLKVWVVSPPGFKPPVRISLLDRVQAWSLKRNALAAEARGDFENAKSAWRATVGNNQADAANLRAALRVIPKTDQPADSANLALTMGVWMIKLGHTNAADLELITTVWNRCDLHERTVLLLAEFPTVVSPSLNRVRAVGLFRGEQVGAFTNLLQSDPALAGEIAGALQADRDVAAMDAAEAEFTAVGLAYLAGWGPQETRAGAMDRLREMAKRPRLERLAYEMQMSVYLARRDVEGCEAALRQLESTGRASLWHQTAYWRLLVLLGRKSEAVALVRDANPVPKTDAEVIRLVTTLSALGLFDEAEQLCRRYLDEPPWLEHSALMRAGFLIQLERWTDLRQLAYKIRSYPMVMDALGGTSAFLEGLAEWHEGYRDNAGRSFQEAARLGFTKPRLALEVAERLIKLGAIQYAEPILLQEHVRKALADDRNYLTSLIKCSYYLRNTQYLGDAATALYRLAPGDPLVMNNYAASLLLLRTNVEQAVIHTLRLTQIYPNRPEMLVNHGAALTMNGRLDEADKVLTEVAPTALDSQGAMAQYQIALFELRLRQGRKQEAEALLRDIKTAELYPVQIEWLEKTALPELQELPQPPPGTGG